MDILIQFLNFLLPYENYAYLLMFAFLLACGFGFPMPEDVILIVGGILSATGACNPWLTFVVCMAGVLIGDGVVFYLGRILGPRVKDTFLFRRIMSPQVDKKVNSVFEKHGIKIVFFARFMPGLRMPIFLSTGIYNLAPWKFFLLDGIAALISVPVWIYLGYAFGSNLELLQQKTEQYQYVVFGTLITAILCLVLFKLFYKSRSTRAA